MVAVTVKCGESSSSIISPGDFLEASMPTMTRSRPHLMCFGKSDRPMVMMAAAKEERVMMMISMMNDDEG